MLPPCGRTVDASRRHYPCATPDRASTAHAGHAPRAPASKLPRAPRRRSGIRRSRVPAESDGIGFLNDLYGRSSIAAPAELSIPFLLDEKSTVVGIWSVFDRYPIRGTFVGRCACTEKQSAKSMAHRTKLPSFRLFISPSLPTHGRACFVPEPGQNIHLPL